jgi:hypothetical protein
MSDSQFGTPYLTAAQLGELFGLTERAVKERVTKKQFACHWSGGTLENPRGMRFTPEDVAYNRNTFVASRAASPPAGLSEAQIRRGVARLRRSQGLAAPPRTNAA